MGDTSRVSTWRDPEGLPWREGHVAGLRGRASWGGPTSVSSWIFILLPVTGSGLGRMDTWRSSPLSEKVLTRVTRMPLRLAVSSFFRGCGRWVCGHQRVRVPFFPLRAMLVVIRSYSYETISLVKKKKASILISTYLGATNTNA